MTTPSLLAALLVGLSPPPPGPTPPHAELPDVVGRLFHGTPWLFELPSGTPPLLVGLDGRERALVAVDDLGALDAPNFSARPQIYTTTTALPEGAYHLAGRGVFAVTSTAQRADLDADAVTEPYDLDLRAEIVEDALYVSVALGNEPDGSRIYLLELEGASAQRRYLFTATDDDFVLTRLPRERFCARVTGLSWSGVRGSPRDIGCLDPDDPADARIVGREVEGCSTTGAPPGLLGAAAVLLAACVRRRGPYRNQSSRKGRE